MTRIAKAKGTFEKGYETNWSEELFVVTKVHGDHTHPMYSISDSNKNPIDGYFYEYELQKVIVKRDQYYKVDKILDTKGKGRSRQFLVKWVGYGDEFNSWLPASNLQEIK